MAKTFHVAAFFEAKPGCSTQLGDRLLALVEPTRRERGSLRYDILQSLDDPNRWHVLEEWSDRGAFDAHMAQPRVVAFLDSAPALCVDEPQLVFLECRSPAAAATQPLE
ncbi:putative quinol monooxygenase [Sphingomonas xinjiangensis]|uniref:Quinol monooxygenase YgiN n=1 Tax=Sphingomonas xinjiangensis TaxID=643568 RepID=A0A840YS19_9SPHN|nr:putative quinol monooxygenase [Sphingomonas xinjiangensis]MBB5712470.1 quinol monooxygenase YgiN [Sphingomonas xinjiangensis]